MILLWYLQHETDSVGSFMSHKNQVKVLWDRTFGFTSKHSQMSLQRQHFLLSYFNTLSVGLAGIWARKLPLSRQVLTQLSLPGGYTYIAP